MTRFVLDSGNPEEYRQISSLAKTHGQLLWGSTTNPSLVAKELTGEKLTREEAFALQKDLVLKILSMVPGAVSAEVYADMETTSGEMIEQGRDIATWDKRVVVKLPTTLEGFKARTILRQENIITNNTLVFTQAQIFAIYLHEKIILKDSRQETGKYPSFISPFVGRLDDIGENGMDLVKHGMSLKEHFKDVNLFMLEASVRSIKHLKEGIRLQAELITAPAKIYENYFNAVEDESENTKLTPIAKWEVPQDLLALNSMDEFISAIESDRLDITHPLTDKGILRFASDWQAILA